MLANIRYWHRTDPEERQSWSRSCAGAFVIPLFKKQNSIRRSDISG
jgi:hypothetical protein